MIEIDVHTQLGSGVHSVDLDYNLQIEKGEFVTLFGESGAGKTSLLRIIAGLLNPNEGMLQVNGEKWNDAGKQLVPPQKRGVGMVFQDYALFPNMTVEGNLKFAARNNEEKSLIPELLKTLELEKLVDRKPNELSGGQQQRVALARALVQKPKILLLDEPLSAVDQSLRERIQPYLKKVHDQYELTIILVSHDIPETIMLSSRVVVIENGKVSKTGKPEEIFQPISTDKPEVTGRVIKKLKKDSGIVYHVLVGDQIAVINVSQENDYKWENGQKVTISLSVN